MNQYKIYCESLKASSNYRYLPNEADGLLDFSTNDYLSLSCRPELLQAAAEAGRKYGCGSTGSRLLSGNRKIFCEFEDQIAKDKQTESAMIFNSGFQANLTVLSSLCDEKALDGKSAILFFDKLNHSSLYNATKLGKAKLERYHHNDTNALEQLLKKYSNKNFHRIIVSETIFGMDGDFADLQRLSDLAQKYNAILYLDEAHATGVFGPKGYGLSTQFDLSDVESVIMGTFSKALGVSGAYIACSKNIKEYLVQRCSGFIYSTAPSPLVIGAAQMSWKLVSEMQSERKNLLSISEYLRENIQKIGLGILNSCSHIIPVKMKSSAHAIWVQNYLKENGILVSSVRKPTVSIPRLRIAICADHSMKDINRLLRAIASSVDKIT